MDQIPPPSASTDAPEFSGLEPLRIVLQGACLRLRLCEMPGIRAEELEDAVAKAIASEQIAPATLDRIQEGITDVLNDLQATERQTRDALKAQLTRLNQQEGRLVDALVDGDLPAPQLKEKLQQIVLSRGAVEERLSRTNESLRHGADRARTAIELLREPGTLKRSSAASTPVSPTRTP